MLSAIGPRGVNIMSSKIEKLKTKQKNKDTTGMASILVNTKVKEYVPEVQSPVGSNAVAPGSIARGKKKR